MSKKQSEKSQWSVENGGVVISGGTSDGMIRICANKMDDRATCLPEENAKDLLGRVFCLVGISRKEASETEKLALELCVHHARERHETQDKLESAIRELGDVKADKARLEQELSVHKKRRLTT